MLRFPALAALSLLTAALLGSCSSADTADAIARPEKQAREFSQAEKQAARALSIGNNTAIEKAGTPYAQTLLCSTAIDSIAARFRESGSLSDQQMHMMDEARALYARRLRTMAGGQGKSESDVRADLQQSAAQNPDVASNARIAVACLQKLQA